MADAIGFSNCFNSGEISDEAQERVDLQPIAHGILAGTNGRVTVAGPMRKRRGFWDVAAIADQTKASRIIPFVKSVDDALALEFGHNVVRVWQTNGAALTNAGVQVSFSSPFAYTDLPALKYKQVGDVIYFRSAAGLAPVTLQRASNTSWAFNDNTFSNGPWLAENADPSFTLTLTGSDEHDANTATGTGSIIAGASVAVAASRALFSPDHVGAKLRVRATDGNPGVTAWEPGVIPTVGTYAVSDGKVYVMQLMGPGGTAPQATTPPTQDSGQQSDGASTWSYRHDGAGVLHITAYTDAQNVTAFVEHTCPLISGQATSYWAEAAYSAHKGWPTMWPAIREERLVDGGSASGIDFLDLTATAGFGPIDEDFTPGLGTGLVVDTDAIRRRLGDDGAKVLWSTVTSYLLVGSASAEYLVAGSVLDEPLSPSSVTVKPLSGYGSEDIAPVKVHKGLVFVARGGTCLRELVVDTSQQTTGDDLTVLARHIADRGFAQLAWTRQPDNTLWARLDDGGLASFVYHQEQNVRGWTGHALPGGWSVQDIAVLPGDGRVDALWLVVSRTKAGVGLQQRIWLLAAPNDGLYMDGAFFWSGAPATVFGGLSHLEGETVGVVADGAKLPDQVVTGGQVTLTAAASIVQLGLRWMLQFKSLPLNLQAPALALNARQRVVGAIVSLSTVDAKVYVDGASASERVRVRTAADVPGVAPRKTRQAVTLPSDTSRDPHIVVEDDSPFDCVIYSIKPKVAHG